MGTPHAGPRPLAAPAPGWAASADTVVVGSGIAGLIAALEARRAGRVLVVTKDVLSAGSTRWAQGGVAAALDEADSPDLHLADTLTAGAGLCDEAAVRVLVTEGPGQLRRLMRRGARFDTDAEGNVALTREGGHLRNRIVHAGGDATGAEISRALEEAVRADPGIEVIEHALVLDLLTDAAGRAAGVTLHVMGAGSRDGVGAALGSAVVLATGGLGQVYSATTNPEVSTGDGVALALRAGAEVMDLEFVQFHPTVLYLGADARGQQPLVSEAVRGEGAVLLDAAGERFMVGEHPLAELAPRDVVSKAITRRIQATGADHVLLDGRVFGAAGWAARFPTILASARKHGLDPAVDPLPVRPAAHYAGGGVRTDLWGRTSVPGLYACGEVACTGVHGANRLASNSLLEGMVFAARIGTDLARARPRPGRPVERPVGRPLLDPAARRPLREAMTSGAGVLRSAGSLEDTLERLAKIAVNATPAVLPDTEAWETSNLHLVATALATGAACRTETRGCHWRQDRPERDDAAWVGNVVLTQGPTGVRARFRPRAVPGDQPDQFRPDVEPKETTG